MVKIAMDMLHEGLIDEKTAVLRCEPGEARRAAHPAFDKKAIANAQVITCGSAHRRAPQRVLWYSSPRDAEKVLEERTRATGAHRDLARGLKGMLDAAGNPGPHRGGMTSHAGRRRGPAVWANAAYRAPASCRSTIDPHDSGQRIHTSRGRSISLNGLTGEVYLGQVVTQAADLERRFRQADGPRRQIPVMKVRANADTPKDAAQATAFGAEGIGLCRTEHMFFEGDRTRLSMRYPPTTRPDAAWRWPLLLPGSSGDFSGCSRP